MANKARAYHAAILDGEGSLYVDSQGYVRYEVEQTGRALLDSLAVDVGIGTVRARRTRPGIHRWAVAARDDLKRYLLWVLPDVRKKVPEVYLALRRLDGTISVEGVRRTFARIRNSYSKEV